MRTTPAYLMMVVAAAGCGRPPDAPAPAGPLTLAAWRELPAAAKLDPESLERLKDGEPRLRTQRGWDAFYRTELAPARAAERRER